MTDAIKPLPCPFCPRGTELVGVNLVEHLGDCPANGRHLLSYWNRRPSPDSERVRKLGMLLETSLLWKQFGPSDPHEGKCECDPQVGYRAPECHAYADFCDALEALSTSPAPEKAKCQTAHAEDCALTINARHGCTCGFSEAKEEADGR